MASDLVQSAVWWEEVVGELAFYFMCLTQEGKKHPTPLKQTYNKEPD